MVWQYEIVEEDGDWLLVERFYDDSNEEPKLDGAYSVVLNGGIDRKDMIHTLQLMVCDTFTDKEMRELDGMFKIRKEVKKLKGLV